MLERFKNKMKSLLSGGRKDISVDHQDTAQTHIDRVEIGISTVDLAKTKRKVTIDLTFIPNDKRDAVDVAVDVKSKLAPQVGVTTTMLLGRNIDTGMVAVAELKSGVPGQTYFDTEDETIKTDTGEPIDDIEAESDSKESKGNVIDLQNQG